MAAITAPVSAIATHAVAPLEVIAPVKMIATAPMPRHCNVRCERACKEKPRRH